MGPPLEGRIVRYADQIAFVNHDIEDAVRAGVLDSPPCRRTARQCWARPSPPRITTMINSILAQRLGMWGWAQRRMEEAFLALRDFMYATVYVDKNAKREEQKVDKVIGELYEYYWTPCGPMSNFYVQLAYQDNGPCRHRLYQRHER